MDFGKKVYNYTTGQWEIDRTQPTTVTNEALLGLKPLDQGPQLTSLSPQPTQPVQPVEPVTQPRAEPVPAAPLTFKQKAAKRLSLLKPTPKDPMVAGWTGPQSSSVPNAVGADDEAYFREMNDQPQTMASGLPPQQTPPDAIQQKFDAQRNAIAELRRANDLANDPELARSKANNDLMSSIFASSLAQQGNTFGQDRTKEIGAIKDSFSAANKSLDSQLTEAERRKAAAGLNEKEGGIAAAQEAELRTVIKDKLGIDVQNTQLKGLELDILVKQASKDNLDAPVSDVLINQAARVGITIKPGTTNREFANDAEFVKSAIANKNAMDMAAMNNASLERREQAKAAEDAKKPKDPNKATSKLIEKIGESVMAASQAYQRIKNSTAALKAVGLKDEDKLQSILSVLPGGEGFDSLVNPEKARVVNALIEDGIRALNATGKVDAAPTQRQIDDMKRSIMAKGTTVAQMKKILADTLKQAETNITIAQKQINSLETHGIGGNWGMEGIDDPANPPGQPDIMGAGALPNGQPSTNSTKVKSAFDLPDKSKK